MRYFPYINDKSVIPFWIFQMCKFCWWNIFLSYCLWFDRTQFDIRFTFSVYVFLWVGHICWVSCVWQSSTFISFCIITEESCHMEVSFNSTVICSYFGRVLLSAMAWKYPLLKWLSVIADVTPRLASLASLLTQTDPFPENVYFIKM